jgi:hypothetical protein
MSVEVDGEHIPVGQLIGLRTNVYLFPAHYLRDLANYTYCTMTLRSVDTEYTLRISVEQFLKLKMIELKEYDIAGVCMGTSGVKSCKDIIPLFLKDSEQKKLLRGSNNSVRIDVADIVTRKNKVCIDRKIHTSMTCTYLPKGMNVSGNQMLGLVKYNAPTKSGDCGAPVTIAENRYYGGRALLGMHVAGRANTEAREGYASVVSQEVAMSIWMTLASYDDVVAKIGDPKEDVTKSLSTRSAMRPITEEEKTTFQSCGITGGSIEPLAMLNEPVNLGTVTKLKPSIMQEEAVFGPPPTLPAVLRTVTVDGEAVIPMVNALKAYQSPHIYHSPDDMASIVSHAMKKHREATVGHPRYILPFEEAVSPPEHMKLKPLNRTSSAGWKYREYVSPAIPGKTFALGYEGDIDFDNPGLLKVREDVLAIIAGAEMKIRSLVLCTDFLKDELRTIEKVQNVKTRAISGAPMDYTIAVRMYFGAFMAATFATYVKNGMAPGLNHYTEWGVLAEALLEKGDKLFDGDFSRFDASEQPWIHDGILRYINDWYKDGPEWEEVHDIVRGVLWLDLVHSRHITGVGNKLDLVVQWNKSLPSGHPLTTIVNSMYSLITLTGCYVRLVGAFNMWDHAYVCTFGDDNITSVDDTVCDVFNQVTVASTMKELFELDYTPGNKGDVLVPYTDIFNVTFLKRSFARDETTNQLVLKSPFLGWVAPLDLNSFLYEGYWYKNLRDPLGDLERRLNHMLCEAALHTPEIWEKYGATTIRWAQEKGVKFEYYTREECRHFVKTRFDVWF